MLGARAARAVLVALACLSASTIAVAEETMKREQATFAAGCFWGVEALFRQVKGVTNATVGYTGGTLAHPSYERVCTNTTGHAEAVLVEFDPARVSYEELLDVFWNNHDPTTMNRQGPDWGSQYRSAIFTHNAAQQAAAEASKQQRERRRQFTRPIVTQIAPAGEFYPAEEYHQRYFEKHGGAQCHINLGPKAPAKAPASAETAPQCPLPLSDAEIKKRLSAAQYHVMREGGTERPFANAYWNNKQPGLYVDPITGDPLFASVDKFDSRTGWPSFTKPIAPEMIHEKTDAGHGMVRTEVLAAQSGSHLGHVFDDGPGPTKLRYCINSAALKFIPLDDLEQAGYGKYRALFRKDAPSPTTSEP